MAEGKKSFVLYTDLIHTVKKMPMDKRGELFTIILEYVNDENPKISDLLIDLVFEPIKRQMKRDLVKYESRANNSRKNGKLGGRPKKNPKNPVGFSKTQLNPTEPKKPDTVNVTVNVTDTVNDILLEKETKELFKNWIDYRKEIKKPIKSNKTLINLANRIKKEGYQKSIRIINNSIENGWQGLFWDSPPPKQKHQAENKPNVFNELEKEFIRITES